MLCGWMTATNTAHILPPVLGSKQAVVFYMLLPFLLSICNEKDPLSSSKLRVFPHVAFSVYIGIFIFISPNLRLHSKGSLSCSCLTGHKILT